MQSIDITHLSGTYAVRHLTPEDVDTVCALCRRNTQYYRYCGSGRTATAEDIRQDMQLLPPHTTPEQKYYIGFFDGAALVAIMDLIRGYPDDDTAFIGFFMLDIGLQGRGVGSALIAEALDYLRTLGCRRCMLGIDKDNPQSNHFWRKNGFQITREVQQERGVILVAEKRLTDAGETK